MKTQKKNIHNKKQNRIMPLILLGGFIIAFSTQIFFNANSSNIKNINRNEVILNPPTAASTVVNTVFINGSDANNDWDDNVFVSQGSGSEISPYIIKDLVINVQGNGSGIEIINSDVHVIIQNCSITNSSENIGSAGITITNSSNITIDNCSIFDNGLYGIHLSSSNSNTISSNNINANTRGILIYNSSNTIASHNNLTNNENYGIASASNSKNSSILWNSINDNGDGINIQSPLFNNITGNKISGNLNGISLNADNVSIDNNIISKNIEMGIALWSSNHTIINNIISENGDCGIFSLLYSVDNMIISNNTFINNNNDDIFIFKLVNSTLKGNTFTFGGLYLVIADNLDLDHSNTLNGRPIHYYEDVIGLNIDGENLGQLILINCSFSTFQNLEISNVKTGIYLMQSTNITLYHNTITNTSKYGIFVAGSINITLRSNILNFSGIKLAFSTEFSIDESNLINGKYFKYYKDQNDVVLDGNIDNIGQLVLENCTNFIIKNLVIANTSYGIQLIDSDNNELKNNTFSDNNEWGIRMDYSNNNVLENNSMIDNGNNGIQIDNCINLTITENIVKGNKWDGIYLQFLQDSIIDANNIQNCRNGISFIGAENNTITNNIISDSIKFGMDLENSDLNNILLNTISNSGNQGIYIYSSNNNTLQNNIILKSGQDGIYISNSEYNQINYNFLRQNQGNGIVIRFSVNSTITENYIIENTDYGLNSHYSNDNDFSRNFFSRNNDWSLLLQTSDNGLGNNWTNTEFLEALIDNDSDGLSNFDELFNYFTDPKLYDTDYDFYNDGIEIYYGTDPNDRDSKPIFTNKYWQSIDSGRNIIECIDENGTVLFDLVATVSNNTRVKLIADTKQSLVYLSNWTLELNLEFDYYYGIDFEHSMYVEGNTTISFYFPDDGTNVSDYQIFQLDLNDSGGEWRNVSKADILISENQRKIIIYNVSPDAIFGIGIDPNHAYLPKTTPNVLPLGIPGYNLIYSMLFAFFGVILLIKHYNKGK